MRNAAQSLLILFVALSVTLIATSLHAERTLDEDLEKARVGGKYDKLLHKIAVPDDVKSYGEFNDWGHYSGTSYKGATALKPGYWVYVAPHWYIFAEKLTEETPPTVTTKPDVIISTIDSTYAPVAPSKFGSFHPEQATGPPNCLVPGDNSLAWAPTTANGSVEWLEFEYAEPITIAKVVVHENCGPGALTKVFGYTRSGMEAEIWSGVDPSPTTALSGVSVVDCLKMKTNKIRILLACNKVSGWNEIDAVGIIDTTGKTHWATKAKASSTYGVGVAPVAFPM